MAYSHFTRRNLLKTGAAGTVFSIIGKASANQHPTPHPGSLTYLDRNQYIHNMEVHGHFFAGHERNGAFQMMVKGNRRFLFQQGQVIEVTDPMSPKIISEKQFQGGMLALGYNKDLQKWIMIASAGVSPTSSHAKAPWGKYDDPSLIDKAINTKGLRGMRVYDVTNPEKIELLSTWSVDKGDPAREIQTGMGSSQNYYDGGKYAYLDAGFDNTFTNMDSPIRYYTNGLQIMDLSDPSKPKWVADWWVPGQTTREMDEYKKWRSYGDKRSFTCKNGPFIVPTKVENGGKYGYSTWGSFGFMIHDVSNPAKPTLVGKWEPPYLPGGIQTYSTDINRLDRGFVVVSPEQSTPDCAQPWHETYTMDVRDVTKPTPIATLPVPAPPAEAPYKDFCDKRGRFGPRMPQVQTAPGKPHPNFTSYVYFIAGLQCFDLSDPAAPRNTAYFIPPQGGSMDEWNSYNRTVDVAFVEWDRKLIWVGADTGLYLVSTPELGKPNFNAMEVEEWSIPGLNEGHP